MMIPRRGAFELGVNFIVVMILSLVVLGVGFMLVTRGAEAWEKQYEQMQAFHEKQIRESMARTGQLVMVYPNTETVQRGEGAIFTVGINNDLGEDSKFRIKVSQAAQTNDPKNKVLYTSDFIQVKNKMSGFTPVKIEIASDGTQKSYIFNVCVYEGDVEPVQCPPPQNQMDSIYGDVQKIIMNAR